MEVIFIIGATISFFMAFLVLKKKERSISDYILLLSVTFPFLTGFILAHGLFATIPFLVNNMYIIHVLSGECMIALIPFLFYKLDLVKDKCLGCAVCEDACPTGAIKLEHEYDINFSTRLDAIADKDKLLISLANDLSTPQETKPGTFTRPIPDMENPQDY